MRIGIIARAEDRGLGILTWEAYRHLPNARALVIDPGKWGQGFTQHFDRYPGQTLVHWDENQQLHEATCRAWLEVVDVVYAAETFYDPRFIGWARDAGVATVLHTMPELHHVNEAERVDALWCPTPWRMEHLPGSRLVPVPVAVERFAKNGAGHAKNGGPVGAPVVLHVAGHAAMADRNGTKLVAAATAFIAPPVSVWTVSQDENVALSANGYRFPATRDYWRLYDLAHVLLMPRRFGGLCLPIQEAMAAGLAVVTLDTPPHDWYGCVTVPSELWSSFPTGSGEVPIYTARDHDIADVVNSLQGQTLVDARERSLAWAEAHSWEALMPLWIDEFQQACTVHTCG